MMKFHLQCLFTGSPVRHRHPLKFANYIAPKKTFAVLYFRSKGHGCCTVRSRCGFRVASWLLMGMGTAMMYLGRIFQRLASQADSCAASAASERDPMFVVRRGTRAGGCCHRSREQACSPQCKMSGCFIHTESPGVVLEVISSSTFIGLLDNGVFL